MNVALYNQSGEKAGTVDLPDGIFGVDLNADLVHQVMVAQMANRRQVSAHTKGRGEVSGGGKKPWAQKHTGRARHGSTRSPIWTGGGVTFGPTNERVYKKKINTKMRRKALFMVLTEKARKDLLVMLEDLKLDSPKTKPLSDLLQKLPCDNKKCVVALPSMDENIIKAGSNIDNIQTIQAKDLNVLDLMNSTYVVMPSSSAKVIEETFAK
jgi:large subunit ribosomal protein L4